MIISLSNEKAGSDHVTPPLCLQEAAAGGDVDVRPAAGPLRQRGELRVHSRLTRKRKTGDVVIKLLNTDQLGIQIQFTAGF